MAICLSISAYLFLLDAFYAATDTSMYIGSHKGFDNEAPHEDADANRPDFCSTFVESDAFGSEDQVADVEG